MGQHDRVLKSHRSHFWQIAVSRDYCSHDVRLTHHLMHDIFLVLECSISIKFGGEKSCTLYMEKRKKLHQGAFSHQTIQEGGSPALLGSPWGERWSREESAQAGAGRSLSTLNFVLGKIYCHGFPFCALVTKASPINSQHY